MENSLQTRAKSFFSVTPSDTATLEEDPNNSKKIAKAFLKNNTDAPITVVVESINGSIGPLKIAPFYTEPVEVVKVFETGTNSITEGDLLAYY
jgi:hypothetical protein